MRTIAIAGGGHAAGRAVRVLRDEGFDGRIVIIGDEPHPPYERPALSKEFLHGDHPLDRCLVNPAAFYEDGRTDLLLGDRVASIDPQAQRLTTAAGTSVGFDRLLIATGTRARLLDGVEVDGAVVHTLRNAADAVRLKPLLRPGARLVLIGGGFIGLEVAASARRLGCAVTVLEAAPALLGRVLGDRLGHHVEALHRANGVDVRTGARIARIDRQPGRAEVTLADGSRLEADALIVGIGAVPNMELAMAAGLRCDDGVIVDEQGRSSVDTIFAVGDVARRHSARYGRSLRLETWENAEKQTAAVCRAMLGKPAQQDEVPWMWTDQFDVNLQILGLPDPAGELVLRGDPASGRFAALTLNDGRVTFAALVNAGRERRPLTTLMTGGALVTAAELADESLPFRKLAQRAAP